MILDFEVFHPTKHPQVKSCFLGGFSLSHLPIDCLVGSCAHLTSFYGTDTISGCILARNYYQAKDIAAHSIPASEHSTMVSWTRPRERQAYENMLGKLIYEHNKSRSICCLDTYPKGIIACVSDSYDIYNACTHIWGEELHEKILARDGTLVVRSDSGW